MQHIIDCKNKISLFKDLLPTRDRDPSWIRTHVVPRLHYKRSYKEYLKLIEVAYACVSCGGFGKHPDN